MNYIPLRFLGLNIQQPINVEIGMGRNTLYLG